MGRPLTILVNLLHAQETLTGTGYYARDLMAALLRLPEAPTIIGLVSPFNEAAFRLADAPEDRYRLVRWGHAWQSVTARRLEEWARLNAAIRAMRPDVFWGPSNFLPLWKTRRMVVTIHDMTFFAHPETLPPVRRWYWHAWTRRTIRVADAIATVSEASKREIVKFGNTNPERVKVIPNGTGRAFFVAGDEAGRDARHDALKRKFPDLPSQYLLFLGTLTPHKNVPRLIEAAAKARTAGCEDLHVVLAGKRGAQFEQIAETISRTRMENYVHELGYAEDALLPALYENARVAALPSFSEGFGLPIVEAMACGTPVLTSNRGATAEVAGDAAVLIDPENADSMADGLARLWRDEALRLDLRRKGIARAAEFSWESAARKMYELFENVT